MADLQNRLDAVFGALTKPGEEQQWRPSTEQVFRVGAPILDQAASSDEEAEFEERARREVVPGAFPAADVSRRQHDALHMQLYYAWRHDAPAGADGSALS